MKKITLKIDDREVEAEIKDKDYKELTKPKKKGLWVPDYGEDYWLVGDNKFIYESLWGGYQLDYFRLYQNNVFRTEEEAKRGAERLEALGRIRKYIHENDMYFEPDWSNFNQYKYNICYEHSIKKFIDELYSTIQGTRILPYLSSMEHVNQVLKDCEEDLKIVFGIEH